MASKPVNKGNGRWFLRVCCGYEGTHKKTISRTVQLDPAMTLKAQEREANKQSSLLEAEVVTGKLSVSEAITLERFVPLFMRDHVQRKGLSPKTRVGYENLLNRFILPNLGTKRLRDIKPGTLNAFYARLETEKPRGHSNNGRLSGIYISKVHRLLRNMLEKAVKWQYIPYNPAIAVDPPAVDTEEFTPYTQEQCFDLINALDSEPLHWKAFALLALYSQMRRGELIALNWSDINLKTGIIDIKHNAVYVPGQNIILKSPKTKAGRRRIQLSSDVLPVLRELKKEQVQAHWNLQEAWIESGAVFTQWNGARMHVDTPSKWFRKFLKRNSLPHIRLHDLRHTGASMLIASGQDVEAVRKRLGHARASTTLDIYAHAFEASEQQAADVLQEVFRQPKIAGK